MAITIQLTEIPQNEHVTNRVFSLPKQGGTFGSSFDCIIELPDRSGQVAATHGRFVADKSNMMIEVLNNHKITINGSSLAPGRLFPIEDGSIIEVADYTMLVSLVRNIEAEEDSDTNINTKMKDVHFSLAGLNNDDFDENIKMKTSELHINQGAQMPHEEDQLPHFMNNGVFVDDPFDEDPFKDEEISLKSEIPATAKISSEQESGQFTKITPEFEEDNSAIFENHSIQKQNEKKEHSNTVTNNSVNSTVSNNSVNNNQIDHLVRLLDTQIVSASEQQSKLFKALDKTLTTFIEEFSPAHLEDIFSDFGTPLFASKEKQYWRLYRKSFNRRLDKGEYHRLFKALLLENMQSKD
ncbi:hypothetical protein CJF42_09640 [Pseudoalteromonas sp. NBT06-2]|uniref:FHA domain-containing protein n=1 Tax=Pseudoalteromonas sp. NBT06-2 TaxID=2025950 RepID=UPI000BA777DA|nr:FHA domain-containing protein [Pseudoalteromonas sp. NBT06-2]PAJ74574.1 hypothetical protein CJF42_09640 [Pseudoalteromonas sp. NBT06-2]